tara:strand:- start:7663 stop:8082 length:420 start_codon:yes stop_codon:yes gene_type:complete
MRNRRNLYRKRKHSYRKSKNVFFSFKYAINGLIYCAKSERNFKIQLLSAFLILLISSLFEFSNIEYIILFSTIFLVLILELINTSIESLVDLLIDKKFNKLARISKDTAATAVFLGSLNSIIVALYLFLPKIKLLFTDL